MSGPSNMFKPKQVLHDNWNVYESKQVNIDGIDLAKV